MLYKAGSFDIIKGVAANISHKQFADDKLNFLWAYDVYIKLC